MTPTSTSVTAQTAHQPSVRIASSVSTDRPNDESRTNPTLTWNRVVGAAVLTGAVFGPLDLAGQVHTPYPFANLFNSPAVWAALAFVVGIRVRDLPRATVGAVVATVVAVETYYLADVVVRGADTSNLTSPTACVWIVLGIGAGVVFGTAGGVVTHRTRWRRVVAQALLPAVFASEAIHQLVRHVTTEPGAGPSDSVEFAALLVVLAAASLTWILHVGHRRDRWQVIAVALVATAFATVVSAALTV